MYPVFYPAANSIVYIPFATYGGANGASITLTGLAVTDIEIYKDGNMTQRGSDAGYALLDSDGIDLDGVTGIHGFSIDLADNTTSGFYVVGSTYFVIVSAITVDGQTVNFIAAWMRIMPAEVAAGVRDVNVTYAGGVPWAETGLAPFEAGTAQGGDTAEITLRAGASATNDKYNNMIVLLVAGTGAGQSKFVTDYVGATKVAAVDSAWLVEPDNTSKYVILSYAAVPGTDVTPVLERLSVLETETCAVVTDGGNSASQVKTNLTHANNDHYKGLLFKIVSGALAGEVQKCSGYNVTTKVLTFASAFTGTPADGVELEVIND